MDTVAFECPSCNRPIRIPCYSRDRFSLSASEFPDNRPSKEYDVRDVLWVNDWLVNENKRLKEVIAKYSMIYEKS